MSTALTKESTFGQILKSRLPQIKALLPKHLTPERMARIALIEVRKNPQLGNCDPMSIMGAVLQSSQLGLELGSALGHAYLLPYKKEAQLILGYRGMLDLARRSGQVLSIDAHVVYEHDLFEFEYGTASRLKHVPTDADPGRPVRIYACAKLRDGAFQFVVLPIAKVDRVCEEALKKTKGHGPWKTHWDEMARKTGVRALFKYLPISVEMQRAVGLDEMADAGVQDNKASFEAEFEDLVETPEKSKTQRVKKAVAKAAGSVGGGGVDPAPVDVDAPPDDWDALDGADLVTAAENLVINDNAAWAALNKLQSSKTSTFEDIRDFCRDYAAKKNS